MINKSIILGHKDAPYHIEFTHAHGHHAGRAPTQDHLLAFYFADAVAWQDACARMRAAGFASVASFNPYWDKNGATFEDPDGYRVVLQSEKWDL